MNRATSAQPAAPVERDCCGNCRAFEARRVANREQFERAGMDPDTGRCRRDPTPVPQHRLNWCMSHTRVAPTTEAGRG
jgi:hypothetical protein